MEVQRGGRIKNKIKIGNNLISHLKKVTVWKGHYRLHEYFVALKILTGAHAQAWCYGKRIQIGQLLKHISTNTQNPKC